MPFDFSDPSTFWSGGYDLGADPGLMSFAPMDFGSFGGAMDIPGWGGGGLFDSSTSPLTYSPAFSPLGFPGGLEGLMSLLGAAQKTVGDPNRPTGPGGPPGGAGGLSGLGQIAALVALLGGGGLGLAGLGQQFAGGPSRTTKSTTTQAPGQRGPLEITPEIRQAVADANKNLSGDIAQSSIENARQRGFSGGLDLLKGAANPIYGPALAQLQGQEAQQQLLLALQLLSNPGFTQTTQTQGPAPSLLSALGPFSSLLGGIGGILGGIGMAQGGRGYNPYNPYFYGRGYGY